MMNKAVFFRSTAWLDESAFEAIFHEHYTKVYAILFRLTGDRYEADDLTAEAFWRLWEHPPAQPENIGGWLYRVATRLGYNRLRSNRRREHYETSVLQQVEESWSGTIPHTADTASEAETRIEREKVHAVFRQMPLRDVQLLVLRHSGLTYKEIAAAIDLAPNSVGKLLTRAENRFEVLYRRGENHAPKR